jgi:diadenosine tetraphosphatase ApaH/serine/threonine PP2A family protein phosphatase
MKVLVISDIHANLAAFEAVLADAKVKVPGYDIVWCLGDVVGYGPDPNECIDLLRTLPNICLAGNHDWAVLGKLDVETFNDNARDAITWTQTQLTPQNLRYLTVRPEQSEQGDFLLVHASPRQPIWEYILDIGSAEANFSCLNLPICLVGHTHAPVVFTRDGKTNMVRASYPETGLPITLRKTNQYIINAGSVGQPRDGDPRAAYAVLDTAALIWSPYRIEYPIKRTQERMQAAGLPQKLIERLDHGH